jgi:hypothetical protein
VPLHVQGVLCVLRRLRRGMAAGQPNAAGWLRAAAGVPRPSLERQQSSGSSSHRSRESEQQGRGAQQPRQGGSGHVIATEGWGPAAVSLPVRRIDASGVMRCRGACNGVSATSCGQRLGRSCCCYLPAGSCCSRWMATSWRAWRAARSCPLVSTHHHRPSPNQPWRVCT